MNIEPHAAPLTDDELAQMLDPGESPSWYGSPAYRLAREVRDRRKADAERDGWEAIARAMHQANVAELERYRALLCPPPCETCKGTGNGPCPDDTDGDGDCSWCSRPGRTHPCPVCHGRPKQTLLDRLDDLAEDLDLYLDEYQTPRSDLLARVRAILADVAKAVNP